ncbi:hypothetical protein [Methylobacterium sp. E-066]|uniref:hypothetical protein n=1 Tax=Methylobacterium sp. E-066 TaxID=2836584 RepID=UPI001FBB6974|nr:hypothetical protein [Methylobacterium sp. E-066]MCJ2140051.1 hypothetical protein [Methylobacterium sp. E-066]
MPRKTLFNLPDWQERCQGLCDTRDYGLFDKLDGTRRAEIVRIAENVADVCPTFPTNRVNMPVGSTKNE